jgi:hypothetical protein
MQRLRCSTWDAILSNWKVVVESAEVVLADGKRKVQVRVPSQKAAKWARVARWIKLLSEVRAHETGVEHFGSLVEKVVEWSNTGNRSGYISMICPDFFSTEVWVLLTWPLIT